MTEPDTPEIVTRLSRLVEGEAKRSALPGQFEPDPELTAEGWERRFMSNREKVQEAAEMYEAMGYEVKTVPVAANEVGDQCGECRLLMQLQFKTVYTRKNVS
jgi:hypothetical protein